MGQNPAEPEEIIPWGRSFKEYCRMFNLEIEALPDSILDCGAGPSNFCSVANSRGSRVVAVDPLYRFPPDEIEKRFQQVVPNILNMMKENADQFLFDRFETPEDVIKGRQNSMERFLDDYAERDAEERYRASSVEDLEFDDGEFRLALSSHFLFLYDRQLSTDFHEQVIREVLRVAEELRIFPLRNFRAEISSHVQPVAETLTTEGYEIEVHEVDYEFQKGANQMLLIR